MVITGDIDEHYIVYEPDTLIGTSQRDKLPYYFS